MVDEFNPIGDFRLGEVPAPNVGDNILIKVHSAALGFPDGLIAQGRYQVRPTLPFVCGMEVSGTVVASPADSDHPVGARVVALTGVTGGCAEFTSVPAQFVYPAPQEDAVWQTGAVVVNYHTAYFALVRRAKVRPGQSVLVQGAGGGVGQATIQVAKALGAEVFAVASSPEKQQAAAAAGADHVLTADDSWTQQVRDLTGNRGIDIVIDPVGGPRFTESLRLLSTEGCLVVVGFASGAIPLAKTNRLLLQNTSVVGAAWREFVEHFPEYGQLMATELNLLFNSGRLKTPQTTSIALSDSARAMSDLMNNTFVGRLSVRMPS